MDSGQQVHSLLCHIPNMVQLSKNACLFLTIAKKRKRRKKKVEHEMIPCFTRLKFVIEFSLQLQKVKFEGDLIESIFVTGNDLQLSVV